MARSPNQDANLRRLTSTEAREIGKKGGKASARSRGALKSFKDALIEGLTKDDQKAMLEALKRSAKRGNLPAYEFLLKQIGQHPDQDPMTETSITLKIEGGSSYGD